jgi:hypothetical protein
MATSPTASINFLNKPTPTHCLCGNLPVNGDIFYYQSKYSKVIVEGIVTFVNNGYIRSKNGTLYNFDEITIKTKSELRDEKIRKLFDEN